MQPGELLLVYNGDDPRSRELAEYYARIRSVPADRFCPVRARLNAEEISREDFERSIRQPIRHWLARHDPQRRIRCIVLFYGLPIRVGPRQASPAEQRVARKWQEEVEAGLRRFDELIAGLEAVASRPAGAPARGGAPPALPQLTTRYQQALGDAGRRLESLPAAGKGHEEYKQVVAAMQAAEGTIGLLGKSDMTGQSPEAVAQVQQLIKQTRAIELKIGELRDKGLADPARDEARRLILQNHGIVGYVQSLQYDIALARTEETTASVDSELTVARYDDYVLYRWLPNALSWRVRANPALVATLTPEQRELPVLMTCRIDGPSASVARRIIDDSIAAEKRGLTGRVYLDSRGIKDDQGLSEYDDDLREFAYLLGRATKLPTAIDKGPDVFGPGMCPEAMLYCGWYSLRQYVDAFEFVRGAVGYHIASFEAISIKAPAERGWVKGLLNDGVAATLGPVAEPYLQSFPKPSEFFGLLLTGRFTLAECFAYTSDCNSWMMLLIGDPLYRPFAANPRLELEQVFPPDRIPPEFRAAATAPATGK